MTRRAFITAHWREVLKLTASVIAFYFAVRLGLAVAVVVAKGIVG